MVNSERYIPKMFAYLFRRDNKKTLFVLILSCLIIVTLFPYLIEIFSHGQLEFVGSSSYINIAKNIVEKRIYSLNGKDPTANRAPVYPLYLSLWVWLFEDNYATPAQIFQSIFDITTGILIIFVSWKIFHSRLATGISFLLYLIHFTYHMEAINMRDTILFAMLLMSFFMVISFEKRSILQYLLLSTLAALLYLTRATGIFAFLLVCIDLFKFRKSSSNLLLNGFVSLIVILMIVLPWQFFVYKSFHTHLFPTSAGGHIFYQANNPDFATLVPYVDIDLFTPYMREILNENGVNFNDEIAHDKFFREMAKNYIKENPGTFIKNCIRKLFVFYSPFPTPLGIGDLEGPRGNIKIVNFHLYKIPLIGFPGVFLILIGVFFYFLNKARHRRISWPEILISLFVVFVTGLHILFFPESRYRFPLDPLLIILAGSGYTSMIRSHFKIRLTVHKIKATKQKAL